MEEPQGDRLEEECGWNYPGDGLDPLEQESFQAEEVWDQLTERQDFLKKVQVQGPEGQWD